VNFKVHLAIERWACGFVRCACGYRAVEKNGNHAWVDGKSRFYAMKREDVTCRRCERNRARYLASRIYR
jgi:hypothetical protein